MIELNQMVVLILVLSEASSLISIGLYQSTLPSGVSKGPFLPIPLLTLIIYFLDASALTRVRWHLQLVLICIPMTRMLNIKKINVFLFVFFLLSTI